MVLQVEISKRGTLFYILDAFLGAYNRRTNVMERANKESADLDKLKDQIDAADAELQEEGK